MLTYFRTIGVFLALLCCLGSVSAQEAERDKYLLNGREFKDEARIEVNILKEDSVKVDAILITTAGQKTLLQNPKWQDEADIPIENVVINIQLPDSTKLPLSHVEVSFIRSGRVVDRFVLNEQMYFGMGMYTDFYQRSK